jgi:hypothetical protein
MTAIEEVLVRHNLDLHAPHWVIYAERGAPHRLRTPKPINPRGDLPPISSLRPYDVEYSEYEGPSEAAAGSAFTVQVTLKNLGWRPWRSDDHSAPVLVSYHWLHADRSMAVKDGRRTPLPEPVLPDRSKRLTLTVEAPAEPGRYTLAIDLVEEGVTWFSEAGAPMLERLHAIRASAT